VNSKERLAKTWTATKRGFRQWPGTGRQRPVCLQVVAGPWSEL